MAEDLADASLAARSAKVFSSSYQNRGQALYDHI